MKTPDIRLIEDYIPIEAISIEARREKSVRKGHISTIHLWWARRPLVAARAAVYGALVPAGKDKKAAKEASKFVEELCKYPGSPEKIQQAQQHILTAHAARLTEERGELVTAEDIEAGRAPRPKVLDMFAGGGAIPLEALRLGCETYALDLNPVAHLIELCTLVYPQQFGAPDATTKGCAPDGTWAGLAKEVEHWGKWVLEKVHDEIGDLYPAIPDPKNNNDDEPKQLNMNLAVKESKPKYTKNMLTPVAYLWTRTVTCKNPSCGATVPLARQTWLAKKKGRLVALQPVIVKGEKRVKYRVVEATTQEELDFNPADGSQAGNVGCPFCGTVADSAYVKAEGIGKRIGVQSMAVVATSSRAKGKIYLAFDEVPAYIWPDDEQIRQRIRHIQEESKQDALGEFTFPDEEIESNPRSMDVDHFGITKWSDLFLPRQTVTLLAFIKWTRKMYQELIKNAYEKENAKTITTYLGFVVDRLADWNTTLCSWAPEKTGGAKIGHTFSRHSLPMVWDFTESGVWGKATGSVELCLNWVVKGIEDAVLATQDSSNSIVKRGSAIALSWGDKVFDAVITDPPYYDNVSYSNLADFFYVLLKRSVGYLYPEHFSSNLTPKKQEAIAAFYRHNGNRQAASEAYEDIMAKSFSEASRVLKNGSPFLIVYAHKTTLGWSTLVDALRKSNFVVTEAWPLDTEMSTRVRALGTASLASSIFLVARKRQEDITGSYENDVRPDLQGIVRERVETLWAQGVTGADLVIACVGAGLRAFTKYANVEYANGSPVPANTFLSEVEGAVLEALLEKLFGVSSAGFGRVDVAARFYILWRFAYGNSPLDAGEAIVFAYPQRVELDGPGSLTHGTNPLVKKEKGKYTLLDFTKRGEDEKLGLPKENQSAPLMDVLHRLLWLVENQPRAISKYLDEARPDVEHLRLIAQTLSGQALGGSDSDAGKSLVAARGAEASALKKLTANWRTLIEEHRGPLA
jgi:putative DNA methylase